ncbi:hypothetical protein BGZ94_002186 [Podila epigama]|nr:hypothetical protein BGZ94_002186 [Podila epigama]
MTSFSPQRHRSNWVARVVSLALLATSAQAACYKLTDSKACPSFNGFSVDDSLQSWLSSVDIKLGSFSDTASFDNAVNNATGMGAAGTCSGYSASMRLPYQNSVLCTLIVHQSKSKCGNSDVPNLCANSCKSYTDGLKSMIDSTCPSDSNIKSNLAKLEGTCTLANNDWPSLQSSEANCISAATNELAFCGKLLQHDMFFIYMH